MRKICDELPTKIASLALFSCKTSTLKIFILKLEINRKILINYFVCDNKNTTLRTNWYLQFISNVLNAIVLLCYVASSEPTLIWLFSRSFWCYTVIMLKRWNNRNNRNISSSWADMCSCIKHVLTITPLRLLCHALYFNKGHHKKINIILMLFHFFCHVILFLTALNKNINSAVLFCFFFHGRNVFIHTKVLFLPNIVHKCV